MSFKLVSRLDETSFYDSPHDVPAKGFSEFYPGPWLGGKALLQATADGTALRLASGVTLRDHADTGVFFCNRSLQILLQKVALRYQASKRDGWGVSMACSRFCQGTLHPACREMMLKIMLLLVFIKTLNEGS